MTNKSEETKYHNVEHFHHMKCPTCGAKPNEPCITKKLRRKRRYIHANRPVLISHIPCIEPETPPKKKKIPS